MRTAIAPSIKACALLRLPITHLPNCSFTKFLDSFTNSLDLTRRSHITFFRLVMGSAVRIRHCPATVSAKNLSNMPLGDPGKALQVHLKRKSGDRPDARHWAFPAAQGEPESFLAILGSIALSCQRFYWRPDSCCSEISLRFLNRSSAQRAGR
jgi:hypothetical protein